MSMPAHRSETSVTISLAELARIEEERVKGEEAARARDRAERARQVREGEAARRAEEAAKLAADEEARTRRAREAAIEKARLEARERLGWRSRASRPRRRRGSQRTMPRVRTS
jgi:hypothetical protein